MNESKLLGVEDAQKEADSMTKKIETGEASNYSDAEKLFVQERHRSLSTADEMLKDMLKSFNEDTLHTDPSAMLNFGLLLKRFRPDLAERVSSRAIPALFIIAMRKTINDWGGKISGEGIMEFVRTFSHGADKLAGRGNELFSLASLKLATDLYIAIMNPRKEHFYKRLYGAEKAKEIKETIERTCPDFDAEEEYLYSHTSEIAEAIHKAYDEFMEKIKDAPEYRVDLKSVLTEIKEEVDKELKRLE